jgi:hypothetical protein
VQAEHDRRVIGHLHVERGIFKTQRQVPFEARVGGRAHIWRESNLHAIAEPRLDVEIPACHVEGVVAVLFVQFGGVYCRNETTPKVTAGKFELAGPCRCVACGLR